MLSAKIVAVNIDQIEGPKEEIISANPIADAAVLAQRARDIYDYIAESRMVGLSTDIGFEKDGKPVDEIMLKNGSTLRIFPESYTSFILFPMLTSFTNGRIVLLGDPGLGKTQISSLMGMMMGLSLNEIRTGKVPGHPSLTIADIFGNLDLAKFAKGEIVPVWRDIVRSRFRFIDEFNRIPTKTQSALLTAVADNYVELYDVVLDMGDAPWFFTANEANGGGTYQVIAALWDRVEASVRAVPINSFDLSRAREIDNKGAFPNNLILSNEEMDAIKSKIGSLPIAEDADARLNYFFSQLNACEAASALISHQFKSNAIEGGKRGDALWSQAHDDPEEYVGAQIENSVGMRIYSSIVKYSKALAWFRGKDKVESEDIRVILPFVMNHRIRPNRSADADDRIIWVDTMWQKAQTRFDEIEANSDTLTYGRLVQKINGKPIAEQVEEIKNYLTLYAQAVDGSSGIEELLKMQVLLQSKRKEMESASKVIQTGDRLVLTPREVIQMYENGRQTPRIGSFVKIPDDASEGVSSLLFSPYALTNAEYSEFIRAGGYGNFEYWSPEGWEWKERKQIGAPKFWSDQKFNVENQPVVGISWYEAQAYLKWAGHNFSNFKEWQYAAAGGLMSAKYSWGNEPVPGRANYADAGGTLKRVNDSDFAPNGYGLFQTTGNVYEWLEDASVCGGAWNSPESDLILTKLKYYDKSSQFPFVGLRVVKR